MDTPIDPTPSCHSRHDANADAAAGDNADRRWLARAVAACVEVARRLSPAYARRLARQRLPIEVHDDLLVLAARRALPLHRPVQRRLPRSAMDARALAFAALVPADRLALLTALGAGGSAADGGAANGSAANGSPATGSPVTGIAARGSATGGGAAGGGAANESVAHESAAEPACAAPARLDHAAAALERLARNVRSARRRGGDAPSARAGRSATRR